MVYLIYPDTPHVYIYTYTMCTWIYHDKRYHLSMICVCIIIYPEWLFFNGIRTGVSQLCLGDIPRRENPTDFFSIPKISNYRRYHPQMVALRQWLSHILHPLGHPLGHPKRAKPKPRSKRSTLAVAPSVGSWNPFLQLKRGSSLEVSK